MTPLVEVGLYIAGVICIMHGIQEALDVFKPGKSRAYYVASVLNVLGSSAAVAAIWSVL